MKNLYIVSFLFLCLQTNAQKPALIYDDNAQLRQVGNFKAIKVSSGIDLYLTQSDNCQVAVSASNNQIRDRIQTSMEGETLVIKFDNSNGWSWSSWGNYKMKAYVSIKELNALTGSGASRIRLLSTITTPKLQVKLLGATDLSGDIETRVFSLNLSGASDYKGKLNATSFVFNGSGASSCEISGTADDLSLDLSGASIAKFYELYAKGAIVNVSGAGTANIRVSELLKGDISGASIINYKGDAIVKEMKASGSSSIRYRN